MSAALLREPRPDLRDSTEIGRYLRWLEPEFGVRGVVDRFAQVEPTVLLAVAGYTYAAREIDRRDDVTRIRAGLPTLRHGVHVPYGPHDLPDTETWAGLLDTDTGPRFDPFPFAHPLAVLFSSGTTGLPKAIVHGPGGILLAGRGDRGDPHGRQPRISDGLPQGRTDPGQGPRPVRTAADRSGR